MLRSSRAQLAKRKRDSACSARAGLDNFGIDLCDCRTFQSSSSRPQCKIAFGLDHPVQNRLQTVRRLNGGKLAQGVAGLRVQEILEEIARFRELFQCILHFFCQWCGVRHLVVLINDRYILDFLVGDSLEALRLHTAETQM